ncbi:hypothetical protein H4R19_002637 [Coemansia spiralis]|nr:hypothetical protein H4R19_002637 [Coemansia spiralis]
MKLRHLVGATGLLLGMAARAVCSPVFVGYYPSWKQGRMNDTDLSKYTHVNIAFGLPHADGTIMMDFELQKIVEDIKSAGSSPVLSIGGWNGSGNFSAIMKNDASRSALLNIVQVIDEHELDGVDIDWEFPGKEGNTKDFDAANDTPNYLAFLTELRKQIDEKFGSGNKLITMAVYALPFSVNGKPSDDVSAFAKVVDYASLMLYDFSGTWNKVTGPNAGLYTDDTAGQLSFATSINAWINAKWPANQLVAGVPFYGKAYTAMVDMTTDPSKMSQPLNLTLPPGDVDDVPDNKDKPVYSGM